MRYLLVATALWHSLAMYYFLLRPRQTLEDFTHERPVSPIAKDLMRFLGALNAVYVALAGWAACHLLPIAWVSLILGLANGSQFVIDLAAHKSAHWKMILLRITLLDGFFMLVYIIHFARCIVFSEISQRN